MTEERMQWSYEIEWTTHEKGLVEICIRSRISRCYIILKGFYNDCYFKYNITILNGADKLLMFFLVNFINEWQLHTITYSVDIYSVIDNSSVITSVYFYVNGRKTIQ